MFRGTFTDSLKYVDRLDGTNFCHWKFNMELVLEGRGQWEYANGRKPRPDSPADCAVWDAADKQVKALIGLSLCKSQQHLVRGKETSAEMWSAIISHYEKNSRQNKLYLRRKLTSIRYQDEDDMSKHIEKLRDVISEMEAVGIEMTDEEISTVLLESLPPSYNSLLAAFDITGTSLTPDSICRQLLQMELREKQRKTPDGNDEERQRTLFVNQNNKKYGRFNGNCHYCKTRGHKSKDCWKKANELKRKNSRNNYCDEGSPSERVTVLFSKVANNSEEENEDWLIDSGATSHITGDKHNFIKFKENDPIKVYFGDESFKLATGKGTVLVNSMYGPVHLTDVLYVPAIKMSLIAVCRLVKKGVVIKMQANICDMTLKKNLIMRATLNDDLYKLRIMKKKEVVNNVRQDISKTELWHRRTGHQSLPKMVLQERLVLGMRLGVQKSLQPCEDCEISKHTRLPFTKELGTKSNRILDLIHSDVCGPFEVTSEGGNRYIITFIDDFSRYKSVDFLRQKSEVFSKFEKYKAMVENQKDTKIKTIRTDNGGEYQSQKMETLTIRCGIKHQRTMPYIPQQNGVAERANRTVLGMTRVMLRTSGVPKKFWPYAAQTAIHILNRTHTEGRQKTPYQLWTGRKPDVSYFRVFGCEAYVQINTKLRKLEERARRCVFLGYSTNQKGYDLYDIDGRRIIASRDVTFCENKFPFRDDNQKLKSSDENCKKANYGGLDEYHVEEHVDENIKEHYENNEEEDNESRKSENDDQSKRDSQNGQNGTKDYTELGTFFDKHGNRKSTRNRSQPVRYGEFVQVCICNMAAKEDPKSVSDALKGPHKEEWYKAMEEEYYSLIGNDTWKLTELPPGRKAIPCKWIFKTKRDAEGRTVKYKARLVAKGFAQKEGIDYHETFAPTARFASIRVFMAIAAFYDLDVIQFDVKAAFLNGLLDEVTFMEQPEMFKVD